MSGIFEIILGVYFLIGFLLATFGPADKDIAKEIENARGTPLLHAYRETQAPSEFKLLLFRLLITAGFILLWPIFIGGIVSSQRKAKEELEEFLEEQRKGLRFQLMGGHGTIACEECDFSQSITSFTHGRDSSTSGFQCQHCGKFHAIRSSGPGHANEHKDRLVCDCGGQLERNEVVFCPSCHSTRLTYSVEFMT